MWKGIEQVKPGAHLGDIGHAIQKFAEGQGQMNVSGAMPTIGLKDIAPNRFAVKLTLDTPTTDLLLPAGAVGDGAVYTDRLAFLHIIRKVMLRVGTKLNYIVPKLH